MEKASQLKAPLKYIVARWERYLAERKDDDFITAYIHIPFCSRRCGYCRYESNVLRSPREIDLCLRGLDREMAPFSKIFKGTKLSGIFIGGGTPSILSIDQIQKLFGIIRKNFDLDLSEGNKFTFEAHPVHLGPDKIDFLAGTFINRVSVGIQTFNRTILKAEKRSNPSNERISFLLGYLMSSFRSKGGEINADLMLGLKKQEIADTIRDVEQLSDIGLPIVTIYPCEKRRSSESERSFEDQVIGWIERIAKARHNYRLLTRNNVFQQSYTFIDKNYDYSNYKQYVNFPIIRNSNIAFGSQADSFIHPGAFYYSRAGSHYKILHDREKNVIHPLLDVWFRNAESRRLRGQG